MLRRGETAYCSLAVSPGLVDTGTQDMPALLESGMPCEVCESVLCIQGSNAAGGVGWGSHGDRGQGERGQ